MPDFIESFAFLPFTPPSSMPVFTSDLAKRRGRVAGQMKHGAASFLLIFRLVRRVHGNDPIAERFALVSGFAWINRNGKRRDCQTKGNADVNALSHLVSRGLRVEPAMALVKSESIGSVPPNILLSGERKGREA